VKSDTAAGGDDSPWLVYNI